MSSGFRKVQLHVGSLCESGASLGLSFLIVEMGVMTLGTGRTVCPQNFYIKVLTPETSKCHCICRRTFQEAIKLKRGCEVGPLSSRTSVFIRNRDQRADGRRRKTPRRRSKETAVCKRGERPRKEPAPLAPRPWTSGPQNCEETRCCRLGTPTPHPPRVVLRSGRPAEECDPRPTAPSRRTQRVMDAP